MPALTFFADCPQCQAPGPHHAEYREYQPPSDDYEVTDAVDIVNGLGQFVRRHTVEYVGTPPVPEHTRYECTHCAHEWRQ